MLTTIHSFDSIQILTCHTLNHPKRPVGCWDMVHLVSHLVSEIFWQNSPLRQSPIFQCRCPQSKKWPWEPCILMSHGKWWYASWIWATPLHDSDILFVMVPKWPLQLSGYPSYCLRDHPTNPTCPVSPAYIPLSVESARGKKQRTTEVRKPKRVWSDRRKNSRVLLWTYPIFVL